MGTGTHQSLSSVRCWVTRTHFISGAKMNTILYSGFPGASMLWLWRFLQYALIHTAVMSLEIRPVNQSKSQFTIMVWLTLINYCKV